MRQVSARGGIQVTRELAELSAAQLEIMNVVWEQGEVTVSEVWQELQRRRNVARATVQTMIFRLEEKGWLQHREVGQAFLFSAAVDREQARRSLAGNLCDRAFDGSVSGLLWALLDSRSVGKKELERIRELIAKAEDRKRRRTKP
jgi:predicted transcriptional regulator